MTIQRRPILWAGRGRGPAGGGSGSTRLWTPGGASIPSAPNFAALLSTQGSPHVLSYNFDGAHPPAGWYSQSAVGSILTPIPDGLGRFVGVLAGDGVLVRAEAYAQWSAVVGGAATVTLILQRVPAGGGAPIVLGTDTETTSGGYWPGTAHVNVTGIGLNAGDSIVAVWTSVGFTVGGDNFGANETWLRVGAGTIVMNSGTVTWVGP